MTTIRSLSRRRLAVATVPLLLVLAGCGSDASSDGTDATTAAPAAAGMCPVGTTDCVDADLGDAGDPIVAEDIHQVDALPAGIRMAEMSSGIAEAPWRIFIQEAVVDGARVDLVFSGGEAPCFVVDHVEASETDTEVVVDLFAGGAGTEDCAQQATSVQAVTVHLSAPVGDRALLDGSRVVR